MRVVIVDGDGAEFGGDIVVFSEKSFNFVVGFYVEFVGYSDVADGG